MTSPGWIKARLLGAMLLSGGSAACGGEYLSCPIFRDTPSDVDIDWALTDVDIDAPTCPIKISGFTVSQAFAATLVGNPNFVIRYGVGPASGWSYAFVRVINQAGFIVSQAGCPVSPSEATRPWRRISWPKSCRRTTTRPKYWPKSPDGSKRGPAWPGSLTRADDSPASTGRTGPGPTSGRTTTSTARTCFRDSPAA